MALNPTTLFGLIGSGIKAATTAYAKSTATKPTSTTTTTQTSTPTSTTNEHMDYINQAYPGGLSAYTKTQQDRYNQALKDNNIELINKLNADAQRVGYSLSNQNVAPVFNNQPYLDQLAALKNEIGNYQSQLGNIPEMPQFDNSAYLKQLSDIQGLIGNYQSQVQKIGTPNFDTSGLEDVQNELSALLSSLENYKGADSMSMDESMAKAYAQLNGIYNTNLDKTLENYNKNAISRGMFGQLPIEALKAQAISDTELNKASATNQLAGDLYNQDFTMARQKDSDYYNNVNQKAGLLTNLYNNEANQYQNAVNEYKAKLDLANAKDSSYYDNIYSQLDLINSQYGANQDQYQNEINEYLNTINLANMRDENYYNDVYRKLDLINSEYGASQDQFNNALSSFTTNLEAEAQRAKTAATASKVSGGSGAEISQEALDEYPEITVPQKIDIWEKATELATKRVPKINYAGETTYDVIPPNYDEVYQMYIQLATMLGYSPYNIQDDDKLANEVLDERAMRAGKTVQDSTRRKLNEERMNQY